MSASKVYENFVRKLYLAITFSHDSRSPPLGANRLGKVPLPRSTWENSHEVVNRIS